MSRPGYVLVFELFELASPNCPHDRVVGWAAIPMCNENLSIIRGKFKLPLLRGTYSPALSHFGHINDALSTDLSNWLCNMYFEVRTIPNSNLSEIVSISTCLIGSTFARHDIARSAYTYMGKIICIMLLTKREIE